MGDIQWTTERRRLGDLIPWEPNPRQLTKEQAVRLRSSIAEFGYSQLYEIEPDNTIIDGHQRDEIMLRMDEYGADAEIEVRVFHRKMTISERSRYVLGKHKGAQGEWNWDKMANLYEFDELKDAGFKDWEIPFNPDESDWEDAFEGLPDEDRAPFQQMTFTLHDEQAEQVKEALKLSKSVGDFDSENENSNGNALARIVETYLTDYGQG